jgi:hypothetical protein
MNGHIIFNKYKDMKQITEFKQQINNCVLQSIATDVRNKTYSYQGDSLALLALLRLLEGLHRNIRDSLFVNSLPNDRQALYALLQNIEEEGGWPFINRMTLRSLLTNLADTTPNELELDKSTQASIECQGFKSQVSLKQGETV